MVRLKAAKMALEGKRLRMVFARQAKYMKQGDSYREIPPDHKLHADLEKILTGEQILNELLLYLQDRPRPVEEMARLLNVPADTVIASFKKLDQRQITNNQ